MASELTMGDMVTIKKSVSHDMGYADQVGIVLKHNKYDIDEDGYTVVAYNKINRRFWACEFSRAELESKHHNIFALLDSYCYWLFDGCWKNTDCSNMKSFLKRLKKIRKKYKKKLKKRLG